jgi:hypothetical protein
MGEFESPTMNPINMSLLVAPMLPHHQVLGASPEDKIDWFKKLLNTKELRCFQIFQRAQIMTEDLTLQRGEPSQRSRILSHCATLSCKEGIAL